MVIKKLKYSLKGSIIEPVVAIVILVVVIGMALTVLTKNNSVISVKAINRANELIQEELFYTLREKSFLNKEQDFDAFTLIKTVDYDVNRARINIILEVKDSKFKSLARKAIVLSERDIVGIEFSKGKKVNDK